MQWHNILGHPSFPLLLEIFPTLSLSSKFHCEPCELGKHCRSVYHVINKRNSIPFHLVHVDVRGPAPTISLFGFRYFVAFIDDYSRATWVYLLKAKSDVSSKDKSFILMVSIQFDKKICIFRSDNVVNTYVGDFPPFLMSVVFFTKLLVQAHQNRMVKPNAAI